MTDSPILPIPVDAPTALSPAIAQLASDAASLIEQAPAAIGLAMARFLPREPTTIQPLVEAPELARARQLKAHTRDSVRNRVRGE